MNDGAGLAMAYDHTQRPIRIARTGVSEQFEYAPDGSRARRRSGGTDTLYFPGTELNPGAPEQARTYVGSSVLVNRTGGSAQVRYLLTDRLGSVDAIAAGDGSLVETRGYDAFGRPRTGTWENKVPPRIGAGAAGNTPRGYTGHEHLDELELIHMNGRVYDYSVGRFTGVDPVIQFPLNSQSLNPYSYILNNPLSGTDPTGYVACGDVSTTTAGSGSCDHTLSNGQTVSVDYNVGKNGSVSVSGNGLSTIAADNVTRSLNGASASKSTEGAVSRAELKSSTNNIGSAVSNVRPNDSKFAATRDLEKELVKRNRVVEYLISAFDATFTSFQWFARDRINELTNSTGFEYRATFSEWSEKLDDGTTSMRYAAVVQTADSPIVSVGTERLTGGGWAYKQGFDMHTHGFFSKGYRLSYLDTLYLATIPISKSVGDRGNADWQGNRRAFSGEDQKYSQRWLATPEGLLHQEKRGKDWVETPMVRP